MPQLRRYKKLCREVDRILKKITGDHCKKCCSSTGGCCDSCDHLKSTGCDTLSLGCKLWLCRLTGNPKDRIYGLNGGVDMQVQILKHPAKVSRLKAIFETGLKHDWIQGRKGIEDIIAGESLKPSKFKEGFEYLNA